MVYELRWSEEAVINLEDTINYIKNRWTEKEVNNFKKKLRKQLALIVKNPFMFPSTELRANLRKAVLSRQTSIFYEVSEQTIFLVYLHLNKQDEGYIR